MRYAPIEPRGMSSNHAWSLSRLTAPWNDEGPILLSGVTVHWRCQASILGSMMFYTEEHDSLRFAIPRGGLCAGGLFKLYKPNGPGPHIPGHSKGKGHPGAQGRPGDARGTQVTRALKRQGAPKSEKGHPEGRGGPR